MSTNCNQDYTYPPFSPTWFVGDGIDCIGAAYVAYYTAVYGADVSNWPALGQSEYGSYAPFSLPTGFELQLTVEVNDSVLGTNDVPIGYWASDSAGFLNLVFRGTEGTFEWSMDGLIGQVASTIPNNQGLPQGCVELGFLTEYQSFTETITDQYKQLINDGYGENGVYILGHSLGAAMSNLAAMELSNLTSSIWLYNIGCPRTGDPDFASTLNTVVPNLFRITSGWDIIPDMPPVMISPLGTQSVYQHTSGQCPVYTSEVEFLAALAATPPDPLFGHHLSTYKEGLQNLIASGVSFNEVR